MPMTKYTYSIQNDFPCSGFNSNRLTQQILDSSITTTLDRIDSHGDTVDIWFTAALSASERTTLDGNTTGPAGGLIAKNMDYFVVKDGSTELEDGATVTINANGIAVKNLTLQYKACNGTNANGANEAVSITPESLIVITALSGNLNGSGSFAFTVGPDTRKGSVRTEVAVGNLDVRIVYFKFV